jgi:hypothetical protein
MILSGGLGYRILFHRKPSKSGMKLLSDDEAKFIEALSETHFPEENAIGVAGSAVSIPSGVDRWLTGMGSQEQMIVRTLLVVVDRWPQLSLSRMDRFSALPFEDRVEMIRGWETGHSDVKRGLAELLRTVVSLHYFEDPRVLASIGLEFGCPEIPQ